MAVYQRGKTWWIEFTYAGKRIRESAKTTRKTLATTYEKNRRLELERKITGASEKPRRLASVSDVVKPYMEAYPLGHRPKAVQWSTERLAHILRLLGSTLLADLTDDAVRDYIRKRIAASVSGRTINMELEELSRAIGHTWGELWPKVPKLEEARDVGIALSNAEEDRLLAALADSRSPTIGAYVRIALLAGMRTGEIRTMQWLRVDFAKRTVMVGKAKTAAGRGRMIPMSPELFDVLTQHAQWFTGRFGETKPEYYLFPFGEKRPTDPTRPTLSVKKAWGSVRRAAGVRCRFHDLRHTAITKMAEAGVPENVMMALVGHLSRAMLERYSHIRMEAKRKAVQSLTTTTPLLIGVPTNLPTVAETERIQ